MGSPRLAMTVTRAMLRRRRRAVRAKTIAVREITKRELAVARLLHPDLDELPRLPATRAECCDGPRPCPFVSCAHHLYLEVNKKNGSIKLNFPDVDPDELPETCELDVAERGGETLEEVGAMLNITRERVRQIEVAALTKLLESRALRDFARPGPDGKRRLTLLTPARDEEEDERHDPTDDGDFDFDVDAFVEDEDASA